MVNQELVVDDVVAFPTSYRQISPAMSIGRIKYFTDKGDDRWTVRLELLKWNDRRGLKWKWNPDLKKSEKIEYKPDDVTIFNVQHLVKIGHMNQD